MRRFLITSKKFTGEAEILYNEKGTLCKIDCTLCVMDAFTVQLFKQAVPATVVDLVNGKSFSKETIIIEADYEVSFDMFWNYYNKKINKARCIILWGKMNKLMQIQAYDGIKEYDKYLKKESWRSKADPETFLRNKYWENVY